MQFGFIQKEFRIVLFLKGVNLLITIRQGGKVVSKNNKITNANYEKCIPHLHYNT